MVITVEIGRKLFTVYLLEFILFFGQGGSSLFVAFSSCSKQGLLFIASHCSGFSYVEHRC